MQIVIDLPENIYNKLADIKFGGFISEWVFDCVKNGKPLPKNHGRLIDVSPYEKFYNPTILYETEDDVHEVYINTIPTIIEEVNADDS